MTDPLTTSVPAAPAIVVHAIEHGIAAAAAAQAVGIPITLRSAEGAGGTVGVGWFSALADEIRAAYPDAQIIFILDCADEAGTALGALRRGIRHVRFTGSDVAADKLAAIGLILDRDARPPLDLLDAVDPETDCRKFLAEFAAAR